VTWWTSGSNRLSLNAETLAIDKVLEVSQLNGNGVGRSILGVLEDPAKAYEAVIKSVGNKFEAFLNALSREKIKINFVAYCKNVGCPVIRNLCGLDVASI
jgi:hypothetical protein